MPSAAPPRPRRFTPLSLAVALAGLALLIVSVRQAGWDNILTSIRGVGPWLLVVVLLGLARMAMRARAWSLCSRVEEGRGLPFRSALAATLAGDALGNLTPLGLLASEPAKIMMARRHVSTVGSVSSVAVENGFYTASVLAMLLGGVWLLLQRVNVPIGLQRVGEAIVLIAVVVAVVVFWMFRTRPAVLSKIGHAMAARRLRTLPPDQLAALEARVYDVVRWPLSRLLHVASWEAMFHVAAVAEVWLILRTMPGGASTTLTDAFLLETTGRFITVAFKFIPYRLGIDEVGSGSVSQLLGLGASTGVALALVRRVRILILNVAGLLLLARSTRAVAPES
ncbi:MAG: flippase-like domain-containing protein [Acidobacteria bacterium]|nr:flippase-like domain-containing protein [Acidobacteriota bacterium]